MVLLAAPCASAQSLAPNYDFEEGGGDTNHPDFIWFPTAKPVGYVPDDSDGFGLGSIVMTPGETELRSGGFAAVPGTVLSWSFDFKIAPRAAGNLRAQLRFFSDLAADGSTTGLFTGEDFYDFAAEAAPAFDTWLTRGPTFVTVPPGTGYADVVLSGGVYGPDLTGDVQWDKIIVTAIPEPGMYVLAASGLVGWIGLKKKGSRVFGGKGLSIGYDRRSQKLPTPSPAN